MKRGVPQDKYDAPVVGRKGRRVRAVFCPHVTVEGYCASGELAAKRVEELRQPGAMTCLVPSCFRNQP